MKRDEKLSYHLGPSHLNDLGGTMVCQLKKYIEELNEKLNITLGHVLHDANSYYGLVCVPQLDGTNQSMRSLGVLFILHKVLYFI